MEKEKASLVYYKVSSRTLFKKNKTTKILASSFKKTPMYLTKEGVIIFNCGVAQNVPFTLKDVSTTHQQKPEKAFAMSNSTTAFPLTDLRLKVTA